MRYGLISRPPGSSARPVIRLLITEVPPGIGEKAVFAGLNAARISSRELLVSVPVPEEWKAQPYDIAAEQVTVGGMLWFADVIPDVLAVITTPAGFHRPARQVIVEAIRGLYAQGESAGAVTVARRLGSSGRAGRAIAPEQDSDVVSLLHREDAYECEFPRAGEADLITALSPS